MKYAILVSSVLLLLCICIKTSRADALPAEARKPLHTAQQYIQKERYNEAAAVLEDYLATAADPAPPEAYLLLGGAYSHAEKTMQALEICKKGLRNFPENAMLHHNAGIAAYSLKRYAEAALHLEKSCTLQKKPQAALLLQTGYAYYQAEHYKDAARVLQLLLDRYTPHQKQWVSLAVHAHLNAGAVRKAEEIILSEIGAESITPDYLKLLANIYLEQEKTASAAAAMELYSRLTTMSAQDFSWLRSLYRYLNAPLLELHTLSRTGAQAGSSQTALQTAKLYAEAGRTLQAVALLQKHAGQNALMEQGKILYNARKFADARTALQKVTAPDLQQQARFYLALCAWEQQQWSSARSSLQQISRQSPFAAQARPYLNILDELDKAKELQPSS
ncbi:Tetratricopeptide TPR_1 repeat-containing protein [Oleidesulfovibrio alaskensis G20]|uniref:Tetratricopeptide TPR_1 repeat-containing protein n=1 Tax=Oleidesulfovibrio alaskensis (strain ATCC BAA-1058 / DSM 17464 / G20) TaxID=207559 RepID=Q30ZE2_OLEA2|nr:tetratricopeptide repeat protein [Oleidesulfovibrio alaskensis]ABB38954.1 Tetratricopeptide TPR_1 repeat-containing protein [Oleidesulfovibrio alaskensis G20]MBG0772261.1 tetratricopeptide repeat protein [Oleidesulfovibrio alaskensis]